MEARSGSGQETSIETKTCTKCGETKPLDEFYRHKSHKDGREYTCKPCSIAKTKAWQAANRERKLAYDRAHHEANRERDNAISRERYEANSEQVNARRKVWRDSNPERSVEIDRRSSLKKYGITPEKYDEMLVAQAGLCACCGTDKQNRGVYFCVDHDHETGVVRGLLCHRCNLGIGQLDDSIEGVMRAVEYLQRAAG